MSIERETLMKEKQLEYDSWMRYVPSLSVARQPIVFLSGTFLYVHSSKVVLLTGQSLLCLRPLKPLEVKWSMRFT
jgi:hypothetical protein